MFKLRSIQKVDLQIDVFFSNLEILEVDFQY